MNNMQKLIGLVCNCFSKNIIIWIVKLAQVWTWLCNQSKCEHRPNDRVQFWKNIKFFKINFLLSKLFKIQYLLNLRSKNYKIMSKNPIHQGLPRRPKAFTNVFKHLNQLWNIYLKIISFNCQWPNYSIFK